MEPLALNPSQSAPPAESAAPRGSRQVPERGPRLRSRPAPRARRSPRSTQRRHTHRRQHRLSSREVCTGRARGRGVLQGSRASPGRGCFGAWLGRGQDVWGGALEGRGDILEESGAGGSCDLRGLERGGRGEAGPRGSGGRRTREPRGLGEGGTRLVFVSNIPNYTSPGKRHKTTYRMGDNIYRACS